MSTEGGKKFDGDKPRWELLPYDALRGVVEVLTDGAKKYSARNWEQGIAYGRVFAALERHVTAWWQGEDKDVESGRSHLDHALCELLFLSTFEKRGMIQLDDRPKSTKRWLYTKDCSICESGAKGLATGQYKTFTCAQHGEIITLK